LLYNAKIRRVIDAVTSSVVLILGRSTEERLQVLNAIRSELRNRGYSPVLLTFERPTNRDLTGNDIDSCGIFLASLLPTSPTLEVSRKSWAALCHIFRLYQYSQFLRPDHLNMPCLSTSCATHLRATNS
jgi:hypothetical protein